ncbi:helicase-exonuclease AddAB subunit AddB [Paenibacillus beijingensis]|uniref:ATP-dependent helicase/deoxyribonuclease subunit B n=1 Tax=Paenibacillus beijingensis TaxID=1126833 RepID=A0A0D5NN18_9BACL|nr:helicase-exonuclease AddAB subunit AddB [Paenibacillus beijingensis]AJY76318.1 ATP-dependent helicase [Paenibacillus beijingensis]
MGLRFVLGRAGSGRTRLCLDEIRKRLVREPLGAPLVMLVPEQATFQNEYALLGSGDVNGTMRAQVLSFRRLAYRVMQETGGAALVPIGDNGKNMLLYKIVQRLGTRLKLFRSGGEQSGFFGKLGELLTEWKRYGIDASALQQGTWDESGGGETLLARKLHDLQLICGELEQELSGQYMDEGDDLIYLAEGYSSASSMRGAEFWVDGFSGLTPRELNVLGSLLLHSANVTVTLCLDRPYAQGEQPHELDLFHPAAETYIKLRELAESLFVTVEEPVMLPVDPPARFRNNPVLAHLEKHFGGRVPMLRRPEGEPDAGIALNAAASRRAEVEAAARDMVRLARDKGLRWREMAVMVRSAGDYEETVKNVFADYRIPYFIDSKSDTLHHPLVELIRSALETVLYGWRYEAVFRCIKTEMLFPEDRRMDRERFDRLENYVLAAGIDGWRWEDAKSWQPLVRGGLEDEPNEASGAEKLLFEEAMKAREAIVPPLSRFGRALKKAPDVRAMCESLYRFLDQAGAPDRLERWARADAEAGRTRQARAHRQLWDAVMNMLDQLVELMGDEEVAPELFAGMIDTGVESLKLSAVPPSLDQVLVGSIDRTRAYRVKACYVLGANDGILPMRAQEDGVLTEKEREQLAERGLTMAPGARRRLLDERFLIYNTLLAPSHRLWIGYPLADDEGKSLYPSEYVRHLKQLFPWLKEQAAAPEPQPDMDGEEQLSYLSIPPRALSYLLSQLRAWRQGTEIKALWWDVYNWFAQRPHWQPKLQLLTASLDYVNQEPQLTVATARQLYGERLTASVSRMERFVSCPFQHFAIHGLRLKERKLFRLAAPDMGQLFHAALSKVAQNLGEKWGDTPPENIRAAASQAVDELTPRLQSQILHSSARYRYIARKLNEIVGQAAVILGEHAQRAQFKPVGLEVGFGPDGPLPALAVPLPRGGGMDIVGRIDRVDAAQTDKGLLLRVLDYKSSATGLRLEEVSHGLSLQMLAYLDVLLTHAPAWLGQEAHPAGVLYFHMHNPLLSSVNGMTPEEAEKTMLKKFKMRGLLLDDSSTVRMMDGRLESGHSELLPVAIKKDGAFQSGSSVASGEQWDVLRRSVRRKIGEIGQSIGDGVISIAPYRLGNKTPCQFCDYKAVCQFDPLAEGNEYVKLAKPGKDETWRKLLELAGDASGSHEADRPG